LSMPILGFGTWQADPGLVGKAVIEAIHQGVRHIDCASVYQNQKEVGEALQKIFSEGVVKREDLFIVSKLWNTEWINPKAGLDRTLKDLQLTYLDLYLVHTPVPFVSGVKDEQGNEEFFPTDEMGRAMIVDDISLLKVWSELEKLVELGLTKSIGLSNFPVTLMRELLSVAKIRPAVQQIEIHPYCTQEGNVWWCLSKGIQITAYSPLGSGQKNGPLHDEKIKELAAKYNVTPAQLLIRYSIDKGYIVIPKSTTPERIRENTNVHGFKLASSEVEAIDRLNKDKRYCDHSQFFNWPIYS